jgi:diguanylate cyclase (GGDEF)-like protein
VSTDQRAQSLDDNFVQLLANELADAESGLGFIYEALDKVAQHWSLEDLILVVDEPPIGRQLFRAGRRPVTASWAPETVENAKPGLYPQPEAFDTDLSNAISSICSIAMRLDLLHHDASHDPLTGLLNRRSFEGLLDQAVSRSQRYGWPFALALIDVNGFKILNDKLGHAAGDAVLQAVGAELRQSLRGGDAAARVGGDEFALILNEAGPGMLSRLLDRLTTAVKKTGIDAEVGFAAGVATAPSDATDPVTLYLLADKRLYEAKAR